MISIRYRCRMLVSLLFVLLFALPAGAQPPTVDAETEAQTRARIEAELQAQGRQPQPPPHAAPDPVAQSAAPPVATDRITQRQFLVSLVDALGWSFGLPDDPRDNDYLTIARGTRLLRVEAERAKQEGDAVSVKSFRTFGRFSGEGWVSGIATPTELHLNFLLPLGGDYRLTAALRLPGHRFLVGDQAFAGDGEQRFTRVELGTARLSAGPQQVTVALPPNGSIDYLDLEGEHRPPIAPRQGWRLDEPLRLDDLAAMLLTLLELEPALPPGTEELAVELEGIPLPAGLSVVSQRHLGAPSGGRWLRAGSAPAELQFSFELEAAGVYDLALRGAAAKPVSGLLNERLPVQIAFPGYLERTPVGTFRLAAGTNRLRLTLPPRAGLDVLYLTPRSDAPEAVRRLIGLPAAGAYASPDQVNELLQVLAAIGVPR